MYFSTAVVAVLAYLFVYTRVTLHDEFQLIRDNNPAAAIALGLSLLGFVLPVVSAIAHSANVVDCLVWSAIGLMVQIAVYFIVKIPVPNLSARIAAGELAPAIWLGLAARRRRAQCRLDDLLNMPQNPTTQFGKRSVPTVQPKAPTKRSSHVALLLAGTVAVGGGAYALMPSENCAPNQPGLAAPANAGCSPRSSSSGGGGSSCYGFYSGDSSANKSASGTSPSGSGTVTRGGFGSFAHAFTSHFSGGG